MVIVLYLCKGGGHVIDTRVILTASAAATTASSASAFTGDDVMAWVLLGINVITLLSNAALTIYRKWRDRDSDKDNGDDTD